MAIDKEVIEIESNLNPYKQVFQCHKCTLKYIIQPEKCNCGYHEFTIKWVYNIESILKFNAFMNLIIGVRRVGKTYAVGEYCINRWLKYKERFIWIRRWKTELGKALDCFKKLGYYHDEKGVYELLEEKQIIINKKGEEKEKIVKKRNYIGEVVTISTASRFRGFENNEFTTIVFDEYADEAQNGTNEKEQILLDSLIVTILDEKIFAKAFVLSNTVNRYLPLFRRANINWQEEWTYNMKADIITHLISHKDLKFIGASKKYLQSGEYFQYAYHNKALHEDTQYVSNIDISILDPIYMITFAFKNYKIYEYQDKIIIDADFYNSNAGEIIDKYSEVYFNTPQNTNMVHWLLDKYKNKKILFTNPSTRTYFFDWVKNYY